MKASDLNNLFRKVSTGHDFQPTIQQEVSSYGELFSKKGSSISMIFDEDEEVIIDNPAIRTLLQETIAGRLSNVALAYICDCLTLSEKVDFKDEEAQNVVYQIADPEINGGFKSQEELKQLIEITR